MECASAASAPEGLAALRLAAAAGKPYDVVLLDYQMPDMDGMDFLREVRKDPLVAQSRCVVLSSLGGRADGADELGVSAWLTKPVRKTQLQRVLALAIGAPSPVRAAQQERPPAARYAGSKVLLVEDNAVNQMVANRLLKGFGIEAHIVENGGARARGHSPRAVRLDLHGLPDARDGWLYRGPRRARRRSPGVRDPRRVPGSPSLP